MDFFRKNSEKMDDDGAKSDDVSGNLSKPAPSKKPPPRLERTAKSRNLRKDSYADKENTAGVISPEPHFVSWHCHPLFDVGTTRDSGWSCSGMETLKGCRGGIDPNKNQGFKQTYGWTRYRCGTCEYDLCEKCVLNGKGELTWENSKEELETKAKKLQDELKEAQTKLIETVAEKNTAEKLKDEQIKELKGSKESVSSRVEELQKLRDEEKRISEEKLNNELKKYQEQLDEYQKVQKELAENVKVKDEKIGELESGTNEMSTRVEELQKDQTRREEEMKKTEETLTEEIKKHQDQLDEYQKVHQELSESVKVKNEKIKTLEDGTTEMNARVEELQKLLENEKKKSEDALSEELKKHQEKLDEFGNLERQLSEMNLKLENANSETVHLNEERHKLQDEIQKVRNDKFSLQNELTTAQTQAKMLENQIGEIRGDETVQLRRQSTAIGDRMVQFESQLNHFREREEQLLEREKELLARSRETEKDITFLQGELTEKNEKTAKIRVRLNFEKLLHAHTRSQVDTEAKKREEAITTFKSDLTQSENEQQKLKTELSELKTNISALQIHLKEKEHSCTDLQGKIDMSETTVGKLEKNLENSQENLKTSETKMKGEISELRLSGGKLKVELEASEKARVQLQNEIERSNSMKTVLEENIEHSKEEMKMLNENMYKFQESLSTSFETRIKSLENEYFKSGTAKLLDLKSFGEELDKFLADKERVDSLQSEAEHLSVELKDTKEDLNRTKGKLKKTSREKVSLEDALRKKERENTNLNEGMKSLQEKLEKMLPSYEEFKTYRLDPLPEEEKSEEERIVKFGSKIGGSNSESCALKFARNEKLFKNEVEKLKELNGDGAPQLIEEFSEDNVVVMSRGLMSLKQYLDTVSRKRCITDITEFNGLVSNFKKCLQRVHTKEIIHCDIRPEHIFMFMTGDCKWRFIGFSFSTFVNDKVEFLAEEKCLLPDLQYASPELVAWHERSIDAQPSGEHQEGEPDIYIENSELLADFPIDMWSLGMVLYECITGKPFFRDPNVAKIRLLKIHETKEIDFGDPPKEFQEHDARELVKSLLNPDPKKRGDWKSIEKYLHGKDTSTGGNAQIMEQLEKIQRSVDEVEKLKEISADIHSSILETKEEVLSSIDAVSLKITNLSDQTSKLGLMMLQKMGDNYPRLFVMLPKSKDEMSRVEQANVFQKTYRLFLVCEGDGSEGSHCHLTGHEGYEVQMASKWVRKALPAIRMGLDVFAKSTWITGVGLPFAGAIQNVLPFDMEEASEYVETIAEQLDELGIEDTLEEYGDTFEEHDDIEEKLADTDGTTTTSLTRMLDETAKNDPDQLKKLLTDSADVVRTFLKEEDDPTGDLRQVMVRSTNEVIWVCEHCSNSDNVVGFVRYDSKEPEEEQGSGGEPEGEVERQGELKEQAQPDLHVAPAPEGEQQISVLSALAKKISVSGPAGKLFMFLILLVSAFTVLYLLSRRLTGGHHKVVRG